MKISERQLLFLFDVVKNTLAIKNPVGGYTYQQRLNMINEIMSQQDNAPQKVGELEDTTLLDNLKVDGQTPS